MRQYSPFRQIDGNNIITMTCGMSNKWHVMNQSQLVDESDMWHEQQMRRDIAVTLSTWIWRKGLYRLNLKKARPNWESSKDIDKIQKNLFNLLFIIKKRYNKKKQNQYPTKGRDIIIRNKSIFNNGKYLVRYFTIKSYCNYQFHHIFNIIKSSF